MNILLASFLEWLGPSLLIVLIFVIGGLLLVLLGGLGEALRNAGNEMGPDPNASADTDEDGLVH